MWWRGGVLVVNNSLLTWTEGRSVQSFARAVFALSPDSCRKARLTPAVFEKACPRLIYLPSVRLVAGHSTFYSRIACWREITNHWNHECRNKRRPLTGRHHLQPHKCRPSPQPALDRILAASQAPIRATRIDTGSGRRGRRLPWR
jgi:hypothetical protein